ncbi:hypothetical protein ACQRIT_007366 [Beauveria bassiana]
MRFSLVVPFAAAVLALDIRNLDKRDEAPEAPGIPKAIRGQFTVIKTIPRRSEGLCKFVIDVIGKPEDATPAMSCWAGGEQMLRNMPRSTAGILAARLAVEYDEACHLDENSSYTTADGSASFPVFSPGDASEVSSVVLGQKREYFFLDCGAVFVSQPGYGSSGSSVAAQVKMIRDSRGLMPILAESFPPGFFAKTSKGPFSATAPPPWLEDALSGI